jgi:hypothetical protein
MNGTRIRAAVALTCTAALIAPGSALAKKHRAHRTKTATPTVVVPHIYDAGGDGAGPLVLAPGVRINLFDPLQVAVALGNQALGQLGLPPVQLPTL